MRIKWLLIAAIIAIVVVSSLFLYVAQLFRNIPSGNHSQLALPPPALNAILLSRGIPTYDSNKYIIPIAQLSYSSVNVSDIYLNATLFKSPPPQRFYVLNASGDCFNCGQVQETIGLIGDYLKAYGVTQNSTSLSTVNQTGLLSMPNDSALIILNGVLPQYMLSAAPGTGTSMIQYLLDKGTDIVYVGRNFANASNGQILVPINASELPDFLAWSAGGVPNTGNQFYFQGGTFTLLAGSEYGPLSYIHAANGSLLVFSNYLSSWSSPSFAAQDIAKSLSQLFWLPKYAYGSGSVSTPSLSNSTGTIGIAFSHLSPSFNYDTALSTPAAYARITVYNNQNYSLAAPGSVYRYLYYQQGFVLNGTASLPESVAPTVQFPTAITIYTGSNTPVEIAPHVTVYYLNMTPVQAIPLPPFTASGNYTLIQPLKFNLPQGQYVAQVQSFYNRQLASALFNITPISIALQSANYSSGAFVFLVSSEQQPLSGINYTININGLYQSAGNVTGGEIFYRLPRGAPQQKGTLNFNIGLLTRSYTYQAVNQPISIQINNQYIEIAVVAILAVIIVTVVKAPNRDEFYIDVPSVREQKETQIGIKASELVSVFDKQNLYFRWRYMPLSVEEMRQAIASNIKYNNSTVSLTYSNTELLMTQLAAAGHLVSADGLYVPKAWLSASGHDIEYLATFKKLRLYFVSHGYQFNELDGSDRADIIATAHNERSYIIIYSRTSRFQKVPMYQDAKTYIAFLNADRRDSFIRYVQTSTGMPTEELKMYISAGQVKLIDADEPQDAFT